MKRYFFIQSILNPDLSLAPSGSGAQGGRQQHQQGPDGGPRGTKRPSNDNDSDSDEEPPDEVRLYEDGFKDRYYESKFGVLPSEPRFRNKVAEEYTLGLCWVLRYYYQVRKKERMLALDMG